MEPKMTILENNHNEMISFIKNLTTLAMNFGDKLPRRLLENLNIPESIETDISIYYRFVYNVVTFLRKSQNMDDYKDIFKAMVQKESKDFNQKVVEQQLELFKIYKKIVISHFQTLNNKIKTSNEISNRNTLVKEMLESCEDICNNSLSPFNRIEAMGRLKIKINGAADLIGKEDLRTMVSLLINRLIPKTTNNYEKIPDARHELVVLISYLNIKFFNNNRGIQLRLKRFTDDNEKKIIKDKFGMDLIP
jgi:hypothetical protein